MLYGIQASLKVFLQEQTGLNAVWIYDGVKLPTEKPFITIEHIQNQTNVLDKMREVAQSILRFQVGIYAKSNAQMNQLVDDVKTKLIFNQIPMVNTSQPDDPPVGFFVCRVERETRIPSDDLTAESDYHRAYLDVSVTANLYKE